MIVTIGLRRVPSAGKAWIEIDGVRVVEATAPELALEGELKIRLDVGEGVEIVEDEASTPVLLESDPEWLDWMPGGRPLWRDETPAQMQRRQATWAPWRRVVARWLGILA